MVGHLAPLSSPLPRYKAVWLVFFMLGLGTLLPWNFFMTATMVRLGDWAPGGMSTGQVGPGSVLVGTGREVLTLLPAPPQYFTNRLGQSQNVSLGTADLSRDIQVSTTPAGPSADRSYLSSIFNNVMTLCAMLPLLIFTCLNSFLHQR